MKEYRRVGQTFPQERSLRLAVRKIFEGARKPLERFTAIYIDDARMAELHGLFLGTEETTDVVTFSLGEGKIIEGEVYISLDTAAHNAVDFGEAFDREVARLVIHGALHLVGFDDHTKKEQLEIRAQEEKYLKAYEKLKRNS